MKRNEIYSIEVNGIMVAAKKCKKCGEIKSLNEFNKEIKLSDGRKTNCRNCQNMIKRKKTEEKYLKEGKIPPKRNARTHDKYKIEVRDTTNGEYSLVGDFKGVSKKVLHKHNKCGYEWRLLPEHFIRGVRCPRCSGLKKRTHVEYVKKVYDILGREYSVIGEYKNNRTKIKHVHNKCGHEWYVVPAMFLYRTRCPKCKESHGERRISEYLNNLNINYERQFKLDDCKNERPLPFDFAVITKRSFVLIEFDGKQHFLINDHWGGEIYFKKIKHNDRIKTKYCRDNGIPLIRIPYWDYDNIETILTEELTKLGVIGKRLITESA